MLAGFYHFSALFPPPQKKKTRKQLQRQKKMDDVPPKSKINEMCKVFGRHLNNVCGTCSFARNYNIITRLLLELIVKEFILTPTFRKE